jgi:hypothetical protein
MKLVKKNINKILETIIMGDSTIKIYLFEKK